MRSFIFLFFFVMLGTHMGVSYVFADDAAPDIPPPESSEEQSLPWYEQYYYGWMDFAEKGIEGPRIGYHIFWSDGLHFDSREKNFRLLFNAAIIADGGTIATDDVLDRAFPDLEGSDVYMRRLDLNLFLNLYDTLEARLVIDFANVQEIKDNWIRFINRPILEKFRFGHFKEPFSLEELDSIRRRTFMEPALSTRAFTPGRNMGASYSDVSDDDRKTWSLGAFLRTGSFSDLGEAKDKISEALGFDLTGRFTILPWYEEFGRKLLHLGFGYSHFFGDDSQSEPNMRFRSRPETRLTDDRLVDTGDLFGKGADSFNLELASILGPLSFQGEFFNTFTDIDEANDPFFWGFYVYGSWFLTGENRNYNVTNGIFSELRPHDSFHLRKGGSGAWELAARLSFIDLNDEGIRGGKEANFTAGINWYPMRKSRFTINYIHALVKNRLDPLIREARANIIQARIQLIF